MTYTGTLTLADGTTATKTWGKLPKFWKDTLTRDLPYGTVLFGAEWTLVKS